MFQSTVSYRKDLLDSLTFLDEGPLLGIRQSSHSICIIVIVNPVFPINITFR